MPVCLELGDITTSRTDAIVNAANPSLAPGGGVSGAIHSAAGPSVAAECRRYVDEHGPVATGDAAATGAGRLAARYVIHAVGPVWHGGTEAEAAQLASAYRRCIEIADGLGLESVAFPSISTGIYGYPVDRAAPIAVEAVKAALPSASAVRDVTFVLFDRGTFAAYERALAAAR